MTKAIRLVGERVCRVNAGNFIMRLFCSFYMLANLLYSFDTVSTCCALRTAVR